MATQTVTIAASFLQAAAQVSDLAKAVKQNPSTPITPEEARYITQTGFHQIYSDTLDALQKNEILKLPNGTTVDSSNFSLGDTMALNLYLQNLTGAKTILVKLSDKILDAQNTSLTSHKI